ncbi:hypothetical protein [Maribacter hydrothermalis]|uniref:Phosphoribosylpyrophosphate synthetase n=1 Tax=Maribacter hydrothermalis TaxID=1836467 RepID=A0A1B7Z1A8_9FLAO|nr:hypothetical protein [Maribacter hydrothermalis]APQ18165.1 hypothetical protein BTR34_12910 [Maribacter hydrothermalis]OBR36512.1 hypothetical protein A9200_08800 [Maribacter hydrothermalis]
MTKEFAKHEIDAITLFEKKGYTASFMCKDDKLIETKTKKSYAPEQIFIVEERRYEGMSNPADSSLLYVIKTNDNVKGTFLATYGAQADINVAEFFKAVPEANYLDKP